VCECGCAAAGLDVVVTLGKDIVDKRPSAGQAWGVTPRSVPGDVSVPRAASAALRAKGQRHAALLVFLRSTGVWHLLSHSARRSLSEQGEKLTTAMHLVALDGTSLCRTLSRARSVPTHSCRRACLGVYCVAPLRSVAACHASVACEFVYRGAL
jgi:hypothetical protein